MALMPDYTFTDMHCHIIPMVDDGSESMEMSMRMLEIAAENNIGSIILTPHHKGGHKNVSPSGMNRRIVELQSEVDQQGMRIDLFPGNEILYDSTVVEKLIAGEVSTMANSDYVLVEFKPWDEFTAIQEGLRELSYEGYRPILAHCERYECLTKDISLVDGLHRNGIYLQVNAGSALPKLFQQIPKFVNELLKREMVSFVGTDAHKDVGRAPYMMECWRYLMKKYDPEYIRCIMRENAEAVINNEEL